MDNRALGFKLVKPQLLLNTDTLPLNREASLHQDLSCKHATFSDVLCYAVSFALAYARACHKVTMLGFHR